MLNRLIHKALWKFTEAFPHRVREIKVDGKPYLRRFYLTPYEHHEQTGELCDRGHGIYLHYFYRGDEDRELHNHPWDRALSFILAGGYFEECRDNKTNEVFVKDRKPGRFNYVKHDCFHRVVAKKEGVHIWTLFWTGNRVQDWGFWDRDQDRYVTHQEIGRAHV